MSEPSDLVTIAATATVLSVSRSTVYEYLRLGHLRGVRLPSTRAGKRGPHRVCRRSIERLLSGDIAEPQQLTPEDVLRHIRADGERGR